jgi:hypothetical protein
LNLLVTRSQGAEDLVLSEERYRLVMAPLEIKFAGKFEIRAY